MTTLTDYHAPHPLDMCDQCTWFEPIVRAIRARGYFADIDPQTGGNVHVVNVPLGRGRYIMGNTEGWSWFDDTPFANDPDSFDDYDCEGHDHRSVDADTLAHYDDDDATTYGTMLGNLIADDIAAHGITVEQQLAAIEEV